MPVFKKVTVVSGNVRIIDLDRIVWLEQKGQGEDRKTYLALEDDVAFFVKESIEEIIGQEVPAAPGEEPPSAWLTAIGVATESGNLILTWSVDIVSRGDNLSDRVAAFDALFAASNGVPPERIILVGNVDGRPTVTDDFHSLDVGRPSPKP